MSVLRPHGRQAQGLPTRRSIESGRMTTRFLEDSDFAAYVDDPELLAAITEE